MTAQVPTVSGALDLFIPINLAVTDMFGDSEIDFVVGFDFDISDMRSELLV
jgi:hypothetical protein